MSIIGAQINGIIDENTQCFVLGMTFVNDEPIFGIARVDEESESNLVFSSTLTDNDELLKYLVMLRLKDINSDKSICYRYKTEGNYNKFTDSKLNSLNLVANDKDLPFLTQKNDKDHIIFMDKRRSDKKSAKEYQAGVWYSMFNYNKTEKPLGAMWTFDEGIERIGKTKTKTLKKMESTVVTFLPIGGQVTKYNSNTCESPFSRQIDSLLWALIHIHGEYTWFDQNTKLSQDRFDYYKSLGFNCDKKESSKCIFAKNGDVQCKNLKFVKKCGTYETCGDDGCAGVVSDKSSHKVKCVRKSDTDEWYEITDGPILVEKTKKKKKNTKDPRVMILLMLIFLIFIVFLMNFMQRGSSN